LHAGGVESGWTWSHVLCHPAKTQAVQARSSEPLTSLVLTSLIGQPFNAGICWSLASLLATGSHLLSSTVLLALSAQWPLYTPSRRSRSVSADGSSVDYTIVKYRAQPCFSHEVTLSYR